MKPIGSTFIQELVNNPPPYLKKYLSDLKILGGFEPNLEKLLLLKPDLIIGYDWQEKEYGLLERIAPTVISEGYADDWNKNFDFVAKVLDREDAAQQAWKHYNTRIKELKLALENQYKNQEISIVFGATDASGLFTPVKRSLVHSIFEDLGLRRPKFQNSTDRYNWITLSEENLDKIDGDVLFIGVTVKKNFKGLEDLKSRPLWRKLRAVQKGQVYPVSYDAWYDSNLLAADAIIDDLYKYLVNASQP